LKGLDKKHNNAYVLVVEDSEINLIFLVAMLEQLGCQVDSAADGREALKLIEQNNYDFALIDINMPIMNGLELAKWLRSRENKLKLIAVSAYADDGKIKEALALGASVGIVNSSQLGEIEVIPSDGKDLCDNSSQARRQLLLSQK
jgi:CheY-like chemotaxis protein